ncbi:hypothetical protein HMPREF1144_1303 [Klebsiella sp. OBRC7]|nr:hypothetical protein HMPREF1144_1303 [Klebsiella sp. OBRC7]
MLVYCAKARLQRLFTVKWSRSLYEIASTLSAEILASGHNEAYLPSFLINALSQWYMNE